MNTAIALRIDTPEDRQVVMTRTFDAPRALVFDAMTRPELLQRWLDAPGRTLEIAESDLRQGGTYRFVWRGPGRSDVGMHGVYREFVRPERFTRTEAWEDWEAGEIVATNVLTERDGRTTWTSTTIFPSREVRDAVMKAGLERNARESYDKLSDYLGSLTANQ